MKSIKLGILAVYLIIVAIWMGAKLPGTDTWSVTDGICGLICFFSSLASGICFWMCVFTEVEPEQDNAPEEK